MAPMIAKKEDQPVGPGDQSHPGTEADTSASPGLRRLNVADLLRGDREIILIHAGAEYRLRLTINDKLILTK